MARTVVRGARGHEPRSGEISPLDAYCTQYQKQYANDAEEWFSLLRSSCCGTEKSSLDTFTSFPDSSGCLSDMHKRTNPLESGGRKGGSAGAQDFTDHSTEVDLAPRRLGQTTSNMDVDAHLGNKEGATEELAETSAQEIERRRRSSC